MDDARPDTSTREIGMDVDSDVDEDDVHVSEKGIEEDEEISGTRLSANTSQGVTQAPKVSTSKKASAWVDPDDATINVSLVTTKRLRKLRDAPSEDVVGGAQYEARLRREFERINPAPEWAMKARKKVREENKRRRIGVGEADADDDGGLDELLSRTDGVLSKDRGKILDKGMIGVERLRDVNQSAKAEGEIKALSFHPFPRVPVLMTASTDRRVRLFTVSDLTIYFSMYGYQFPIFLILHKSRSMAIRIHTF